MHLDFRLLLLLPFLWLPTYAAAAKAEKAESCPFKHVGRFTALVSKPMGMLRRKNAKELPLTTPAPFQSIGKSNLVNASATQRYLRTITDRLSKGSSLKPIHKPNILVSSASFYQAQAMFDRGIVVTIGMLDKAESDAEIAFVLAHELSHIALGHIDDQDSLRRSLAKLDVLQRGVDYISQVSAMSVESANQLQSTPDAQRSKAAEQEIEQHNKKIEEYIAELQELLERVAKPAWTAAQEDEADLNAIEMLVRAKYSPSGAALAMDHMKTAQADACAELKKLVADLESFKDKAESYDWVESLNDPEQGVMWQKAIRPLKKSAEEKLRKTVLASAMPQTHRPWKKRKARLLKHMQSEYMKPLLGSYNAPTGGLEKIRAATEYKKNISSSNAISEFKSAMLAEEYSTAAKIISVVDTNTSQGRLLKKRLRDAQGKPSEGVENLRIASGFKTPSLSVFEQYGAALMEGNRYADVLAQTKRASELFEDETHFLPESIYITVKRNADGMVVEADRLLNRCLSAARSDLWKLCEAARTGLSPDFRESANLILAANCEATDCEQGRFRIPWNWGKAADKKSAGQ